jgi:hypothetical protein
MQPILCGLETEYGLYVEGHGAEEQIDDSMALVQSYPDECFVGWDYRFESPRADLRGFSVGQLSIDPEDAKFDHGKVRASDRELRADRILANGARFYNDHGHPEYATPERWSLFDAIHADIEGEKAVWRAAQAFAAASGCAVKVYKNNTDFHGASYGSHESYLVPRSIGWEKLYRALLPLLIARVSFCGSGKVGAESGAPCGFQRSQRADFFAEPFNVDTLFRRPIFNMRDEPHADAAKWMRLHVIAGDANRMPVANAMKVGLVRLGIALLLAGHEPEWTIERPVRAIQELSRFEGNDLEFRLELGSGSWTILDELFESYFSEAEALGIDADPDLEWVIQTGRQLLRSMASDGEMLRRCVDWAAKRSILESAIAEESLDWKDPSLRAYDLAYHDIDPEASLFHALEEMGDVQRIPKGPQLPSRADLRAFAVQNFRSQIITAGWRVISFDGDGRAETVELPVEWNLPVNDDFASDVETFVRKIRGTDADQS